MKRWSTGVSHSHAFVLLSATLAATALAAAAAEPVRTLPAPPGPILDLRANAAGDLYVRTATNVLWMDLHHPEEGWNAIALDGVVDLAENVGREVFARQDLKTRFAIHRLVGGVAKQVALTTNAPCERWYVDAVGRVWIQGNSRLLVAGREETLLDTPVQRLGTAYRQPCEWQPGHVALICGTEAFLAGQDKVTSNPSPPFAGDASCVGPYRLGKDRLLAGCDRKSSRVSAGLVDPLKPDQPPERLSLGWDWFYGMVTAPDGRLLVLGQTDRDPQFTFFWYAADGRSQVRLNGADDVIRAGRAQHKMAELGVVFSSNSVGYAAIADGTLAVFGPEEVSLITPNRGLPIPRVERLAVVGDDLIMAGGGKIVVWRTTEPFKSDVGFDDLREWPLAGPCVRDVNGRMWAFLHDFPGKLSRHDGKQWRHYDSALGNRTPLEMTGDELGRLQIGFGDALAGSSLVTSGVSTNYPNAPTRAWTESCGTGGVRFSDGSPFRPQHVTTGKSGECWLYAGRIFWDGRRECDFSDAPSSQYCLFGPDGQCYRGGAGQLWAFVNGRWSETEPPPLSIGADGIFAVAPAAGRLPVVYDGQLKLPLRDAERGGKRQFLPLSGNEAFIPAGDGDGWVGGYRVFRGSYYPLAGRVYPGTNGHYLVADKALRFQRPQALKLEGELLADGNDRFLSCRITGVEPLYKPRLLVFLDGKFLETVSAPAGAKLPPLQPGLHSLEVYAADGFGVVSDSSLWLTADGGPSVEPKASDLGEEWAIKSCRLQELPETAAGQSVLGRTMEIDADGVVWILGTGNILSVDPASRRAAVHRLDAAGLLCARGRVWAFGKYDSAGRKTPLYELRRDGARFAVDLDGSPAVADPDGGIWMLTKTSAARWDGRRTRYWGRNFGAVPEISATPAGVLIQDSWEGICHVYRRGELSQTISGYGKMEGVYESLGMTVSAWPLGTNHMVMLKSGDVVNLDTGRPVGIKFPYGVFSRRDAAGNLYFWEKGKLCRLSGTDLKQSPLATARRLMSQKEWGWGGPGWFDAFLATTNGTCVYSAGPDWLVVVPNGGEAVEYGLGQGVLPGRTRAIREAPDGRVWILRSEQLLVYDPAGPSDALPKGWPGWRGTEVAPYLLAGGFGRIWYAPANKPNATCTDGTNVTTWSITTDGDLIVGDQGTAMVFWSSDTYVLESGRPFTRVNDRERAILELIRGGTKRFAGSSPPVVAADGRVHFRGRLWDGQAWQTSVKGRASVDLRGELFVLCRPDASPPIVCRIDGVAATFLGAATQCMVDEDGLRWSDAGLLETSPGCLPLWRPGVDGPELASAENAVWTKIDPHASLQAFPLGDGRFLVRVGLGLHVLEANGMTPLPGDRLPCKGVRAVYRLTDDRWAFVSAGGILLVSPPGMNLVR